MSEMTNSNTKLTIKQYISYLFVLTAMAFVLNKFHLRPFVQKNSYPEFLQIVVLSLPNFAEAVMGTLLLTGILLQVRQHFSKKFGTIKTSHVYLIALSLASVYVISQELKFHNIGGNNTYDHFDIIASLIGLTFTYLIISKFGFAD